VLGHEGAGIVREVGANVTRVKAGDHVVLCWAPACGVCPACVQGRAVICDRLDRTIYRNRLPSGAVRLHARGQDLNHFLGTACFADYTVVAEEAAVVVDRALPFDALAMLGCAVVTGIGAVMTAAQVPAGARIAVIGAGGVGLNAIQAGVLSEAAQIIAIDRHAAPLALARTFGATDIVEAPANISEAIHELTAGRGAEFVFDTVGTPATLRDALAAAAKGGTVVLTGLSRIDAIASVQMFPFVMHEKRLIGSTYGSGRPIDDIARLTHWFQEGRLKLRELVNRTYTLNQIDDALDALARSAGARGVITSVK
jgi:S-(hydroxymethyl)glutathione dehydrogenase/alcohol dehydrogenase